MIYKDIEHTDSVQTPLRNSKQISPRTRTKQCRSSTELQQQRPSRMPNTDKLREKVCCIGNFMQFQHVCFSDSLPNSSTQFRGKFLRIHLNSTKFWCRWAPSNGRSCANAACNATRKSLTTMRLGLTNFSNSSEIQHVSEMSRKPESPQSLKLANTEELEIHMI